MFSRREFFIVISALIPNAPSIPNASVNALFFFTEYLPFLAVFSGRLSGTDGGWRRMGENPIVQFRGFTPLPLFTRPCAAPRPRPALLS